MHEQRNGEYLESMRDHGQLALFWEGYEAGNGWNLFDDFAHVYEWLNWLVSDFTDLPAEDKERLEAGLQELEQLLPKCDEERPSQEQFLDKANAFLDDFDECMHGKGHTDGQRFYSFRRLVSDPGFVEEFAEHLRDGGLSACRPEDNLAEFERMLGRYPGPGYWTP